MLTFDFLENLVGLTDDWGDILLDLFLGLLLFLHLIVDKDLTRFVKNVLLVEGSMAKLLCICLIVKNSVDPAADYGHLEDLVDGWPMLWVDREKLLDQALHLHGEAT